jgi:hypothetical protein
MKLQSLVKNILLFLTVLSITTSIVTAQSNEEKGITGEPPEAQTGGEPDFKPDSVIIFTSSRPLTTYKEEIANKFNAYGAIIAFSGAGFGGGAFYKRVINDNWSFDAEFQFNEARNSDEFEQPNLEYRLYLVPGKRNRLYFMPFSMGVTRYLFKNELFESLSPFVTVGGGLALIAKTPYFRSMGVDDTGNYFETDYRNFFQAWGDATIYGRPSLYFGLGADFGKIGKTTSSINLRYYYTPFGGEGLESMSYQFTGVPAMTNFGGFMITLNFGPRF